MTHSLHPRVAPNANVEAVNMFCLFVNVPQLLSFLPPRFPFSAMELVSRSSQLSLSCLCENCSCFWVGVTLSASLIRRLCAPLTDAVVQRLKTPLSDPRSTFLLASFHKMSGRNIMIFLYYFQKEKTIPRRGNAAPSDYLLTIRCCHLCATALGAVGIFVGQSNQNKKKKRADTQQGKKKNRWPCKVNELEALSLFLWIYCAVTKDETWRIVGAFSMTCSEAVASPSASSSLSSFSSCLFPLFAKILSFFSLIFTHTPTAVCPYTAHRISSV